MTAKRRDRMVELHRVILHWLGDMFDPHLSGCLGSPRFEEALETALEVIHRNTAKVDGIKISLPDKDRETRHRGGGRNAEGSGRPGG